MMKFRMTLTCLEARVLGAALFVTDAGPDRRSTIRARLATRITLPVPSQITTLLERILASSAEDHDATVVTGLGEYGGRPSALLELRDRILQQADL
jgi:hypothetical protein